MIFALLAPPQGHQFDPRLKILLAFCSTNLPHQFDMPYDHVQIKEGLGPSGAHLRMTVYKGIGEHSSSQSPAMNFNRSAVSLLKT